MHCLPVSPGFFLQRADVARWLFGLWGEEVRGVPGYHPLAAAPGDAQAIARWIVDETARRRATIDDVLEALETEGDQTVTVEARHAASIVLTTTVIDGLRQQRAWTGAHDDPNAAGYHLDDRMLNVYLRLRAYQQTVGAGAYVCEGDDRGPGCSLVFHRERSPKTTGRCDVCRERPIPRPLGPHVAEWSSSFDPACRTMNIVRVCADCGADATPSWRTGSAGRPHMYCPACSTIAATTARSRRAP